MPQRLLWHDAKMALVSIFKKNGQLCQIILHIKLVNVYKGDRKKMLDTKREVKKKKYTKQWYKHWEWVEHFSTNYMFHWVLDL